MKDPDVKPEWRTGTVTGLCNAMRQTQDFSALPILADALQDAGCDDDELLAELRGPTPPYFRAARLVAFVLTDAAAESARWLEEVAEQFPESYDGQTIDYGTLVAAAKDRIETGEYLTEHGSQGWQDVLFGREKEFWRHYQTITGAHVPDDEASFFSCSC